MRRWTPKLPAFLIAIVLAAATVALLDLPVATIGARFPALDTSFPAPALPAISGERLITLLPAALTIAFLAGIESLLSAAVADGMTGFRHRSNLELLAPGRRQHRLGAVRRPARHRRHRPHRDQHPQRRPQPPSPA